MAITTIGTNGIADNTITGAKVALASQATGDVMYYNGTDWIRVGIGTDGQVLTVNNAENAPGWEAAAAGGATIGNSPTANELVTVASTTSNLDAESALTFDGAGEFTYDTATGSTNFIIHNSATSGSYNHSRLILRLAEANTTGDTYITFQEQNVYEYAMGVDNSDGNKFKISGSALGTNDKLIIDADGRLGIGTSVPNDTMIKASWSTQSWVFNFTNAHGSGSNHVGQMNFGGFAPDSANNIYLYCADNAAARLIIYSDGDILNHDGTYGQMSDERIKESIRDANSQWDDVKAIRVRNFKRKEDVAQYGERAWEQIGTVAQEVELISPRLVKENPPTLFEMSQLGMGTEVENGEGETKWIPNVDEDGNEVTIKSMKYSILYMKAFKALQEAMARIEILETKVTTLGG